MNFLVLVASLSWNQLFAITTNQDEAIVPQTRADLISTIPEPESYLPKAQRGTIFVSYEFWPKEKVLRLQFGKYRNAMGLKEEIIVISTDTSKRKYLVVKPKLHGQPSSSQETVQGFNWEKMVDEKCPLLIKEILGSRDHQAGFLIVEEACIRFSDRQLHPQSS